MGSRKQNLLVELKEVKNKLQTDQFVKQFMAYLGAVKDMSYLRYYFKASTVVTEKAVKEEFQALLKAKTNEIFEAIWANVSFRGSLFQETINQTGQWLDNNKQRIKGEFYTEISDTNNDFYNFINVR